MRTSLCLSVLVLACFGAMSLAPVLAEQPEVTFVGRQLTVIHNGQKLHDAVDVGPRGTGNSSERPDGPGPLRLQGDHEEVSFRNIWIRPRR